MSVSTAHAQVPIVGIEEMEEVDHAAITVTLTQLFAGFVRRDVGLLSEVYAADTDWINAFGTYKKGGRRSAGYLQGLFADKTRRRPRHVRTRLHPSTPRRRQRSRPHPPPIAGQGLWRRRHPLRDNRSVRVLPGNQTEPRASSPRCPTPAPTQLPVPLLTSTNLTRSQQPCTSLSYSCRPLSSRSLQASSISRSQAATRWSYSESGGPSGESALGSPSRG